MLGYRGRDEMIHRDDLVVTLRQAASPLGEIGEMARASTTARSRARLAAGPASPRGEAQDEMRAIGQRARAAARRCSRRSPKPKEPALRCGRASCAPAGADLLAANARDMARGQAACTAARCSTGWRSTPSASRRWRKASRTVAALPDPVGDRSWPMDAAQRPRHRARARAARRHRHHLREPAQRHRRCRRALPQGRQRRDPARRLGELPFVRARSSPACAEGLRAAGLPRDAIQLVPTTRPRGGRHHAAR